MIIDADKYQELVVDYEAEISTIWLSMNPQGRPCFTLTMLNELLSFCDQVDEAGCIGELSTGAIKYVVIQSDHPKIYNAGGDLTYFFELIEQADEDKLRAYGIACIKLIYWVLTGGKQQITTIGNVAGEAFGGGFESALASQYLIAEEQASFAFPEALFGLFPGMGSYQLFERYVGIVEADKAFFSGKRYSAQQLKSLGVLYHIAKTGQGRQRVKEFIKERVNNPIPHFALQQIKQRQLQITYESLEYSVDLWAKLALSLSKRDQRIMRALIYRQKKKALK